MHYLRVTYFDGTASDELFSVSVAADGKIILSPTDSNAEISIAEGISVKAIELRERGAAKKVAE
jgi:hypothetical protein